MRKIVFIATNEWTRWGGSEILWSLSAERLANRGVQVYISAKDWGAPVREVERLRSVGCRIFKRPPPSLAQRFSRRLFPGRQYSREHVRRLGVDASLIVISQGGNADGLAWMEGARLAGYRYAVISQSASEQWGVDDDHAERLAVCYENACGAYFVSEANLSLTRQQFVTPLSHGRVVRNPFNVSYDARPAWPGDPGLGLSLACLGRLDPFQKGQDLLFQVLNLPHWRTRNIRVSLVGSGMFERGLQRLAKALKLNSVEFLGFVSDIEDVWSKHHALVLPSRYEGMPLALVEAMLCGRTCVVTDVAGHRELVRNGINGFLAQAPTVELLDAAMNRLWDARHNLKQIGATAAEDVRRWVPRDPVEDFVQHLVSLCGKTEDVPSMR
jgi:glycosyltransferase involved in cell wall biosynthesis